MRYYIEVPLDERSTILVDVSRSVEGTVPVSADDNVVGRLKSKLGDALDQISPLFVTLRDNLSRQLPGPGKVTVEFGLSFGGSAGLVLAEVTSDAHFQVSFEWEHPAGDGEPLPIGQGDET